ncbi:MAG: hypothetical protein H0T75_00855 [Rhizobiales bacterium]|nr:hypothetical protein [Hyphomicrobiales bacterium]MDQ3559088.1 hypothetical protein [Pseudomonadota bacterium]
MPGFRSPFHDTHPFWVLVEIEGFAAAELDAILEEAAAEGFVAEALFAASQVQRVAFRRLREALPDANGRASWIVAHDVCVPIALIPDYLAQLRSALLRVAPGCRESVFGHLGDGNLHVTILPPREVSVSAELWLPESLSEAVLGPALALGVGQR